MLPTGPWAENQIRSIDVVDIMGVIVVLLCMNGFFGGRIVKHIQQIG